MCNYGSILRELPENENISIILIGLGEESEESTHRVNKVHIISKTSVLQCQSGEIDRLTLQQSSAQYSY
jgi:altronate dehydratase